MGNAFHLKAGNNGKPVRLHTLIFLRWLAIGGQLAAVIIADRWFGLHLQLGLCLIAIGAATAANLAALLAFPESRRLSEREALAMLHFDLAQLSFLLFASGGLANPFALLVLAPVTIAASTLGLRSTLTLGASAVVMISLAARFNFPIVMPDGSPLRLPPIFQFGYWVSIVVGLVFLGIYSRRVATETREMSDALLATQMALAREQTLTDLGGVVAAAAHELGTPLATIKLTSTEMMDELTDRPALLEDARLIRDQADRCRDILHGMGRVGKDDLQLRQAPLGTLLREAAEPHMARGKQVIFSLAAGEGADMRQPNVRRRPEIIHGLRNLVQNAVDFARSTVWVDGEWTKDHVTVRITDDGDGFPPGMIGRLGEPFVRARRGERPGGEKRPEYKGMGLGLFIAKTLLERTGAELSFANAADPFLAPDERPDRCGAIVEATWPAGTFLAPGDLAAAPNQPIAY